MSQNIDNLFVLARRAKDNNDSAAAAKYYEQILLEDPNNWEAVFYADYFTASSCVIRDIAPSAVRVKNAFINAFNILRNSDIENKSKKIYEIANKSSHLLAELSDSAQSFYKEHNSASDALDEYKIRIYECGLSSCAIGDCFYKTGDKDAAATCYKNAKKLWKGLYELNDVAVNRIREVDPEFQKPSTDSNTSGGGCYVATAVYGSYDCPEVWTLRRYRDYTLAGTRCGRAFIRAYYAISPKLVKRFGHTEWFKRMWQRKLDRMVAELQKNGVESTPYEDRKW